MSKYLTRVQIRDDDVKCNDKASGYSVNTISFCTLLHGSPNIQDAVAGSGRVATVMLPMKVPVTEETVASERPNNIYQDKRVPVVGLKVGLSTAVLVALSIMASCSSFLSTAS
jgi:hypothetical protein